MGPKKTRANSGRVTRSNNTDKNQNRESDLRGFDEVSSEDVKKSNIDVDHVLDALCNEIGDPDDKKSRGKKVVDEGEQSGTHTPDDLDKIAMEFGDDDAGSLPVIEEKENEGPSAVKTAEKKTPGKQLQIQKYQEEKAAELKNQVETDLVDLDDGEEEPQDEPEDREYEEKIRTIESLFPGILRDLNAAGVAPDKAEQEAIFEYLLNEQILEKNVDEFRALVWGYRKKSEKSLKSHESYLSDFTKKIAAISREMRQGVIEMKKQNDEYRRINMNMKSIGVQTGKAVSKPSSDPIPVPSGASKLSSMVGLPPSSSKTVATKSAKELMNLGKPSKEKSKMEDIRKMLKERKEMKSVAKYKMYCDILEISQKALIDIDSDEKLAMACIVNVCDKIGESELSKASGNKDMAREYRYSVLEGAAIAAKNHHKKQKRSREDEESEEEY